MIKRRLSNESSISEVIDAIIQKNNLEKGLDAIAAENAWKNIMGNGVNTYTQEIVLKNKILIVSFSSSIVRNELSLGKEKIIKMLNEELGKEIIENILFR
jgi:hypothetical protein